MRQQCRLPKNKKIICQIPFILEYGIIKNKIIILQYVRSGEISGIKNGKKNNCHTGLHVKQKTHTNLGNTVKNCAPNTPCTRVYVCALIKQTAQYLVFVFLPTQKEAKRTKNYSQS
jgi:hypothetical protein